MGNTWDKKIAGSKRGIKASQKAIDNYRLQIKKSRSSRRKQELREKIKRATKKIAIHKNSIKHYQGRKSGRIKALDYSRKFK